MKNLLINGVTYENVNNIKLPTAEGRTATYVDYDMKKQYRASFVSCKAGVVGQGTAVMNKKQFSASGIVETIRSIKYTSSASEVQSDTKLTSSVECNVGDLVVAAIATRDTLTLSDGWNLISTSNVNSMDTSNGHRLSWAYKTAESTSESITVTQASSQRLYINMIALKGATGVTDKGYSYRDDTTSGDLTVDKPSGLVLWGMTTPLWGTVTPYLQWIASNNIPIIQLGTNTQSRLGLGIDQTKETRVKFLSGSDASTIIVGCLTVQGIENEE